MDGIIGCWLGCWLALVDLSILDFCSSGGDTYASAERKACHGWREERGNQHVRFLRLNKVCAPPPLHSVATRESTLAKGFSLLSEIVADWVQLHVDW